MELIRTQKEGETAHAGIIQNDFGAGDYRLDDLANDSRAASELARIYDKRNGTTGHSQLVQINAEWKKFAVGNMTP